MNQQTVSRQKSVNSIVGSEGRLQVAECGMETQFHIRQIGDILHRSHNTIN